VRRPGITAHNPAPFGPRRPFLAQAQGRSDDALTLVRPAADLEDASDNHGRLPAPILHQTGIDPLFDHGFGS
jgi:hypothetical protein